jgi:2-keto-3-deoxy-L-rhamnonate aldolase RhmA
MLGIMVEDVEGVERFDEIASVDGIDFIHIGAADLAQSMGPDHLGRPAHPDVRATVHDLVRRGAELGVAMGAAVNVDNVGAALDRGARFLVVNPAAEVGAALAGFRAHLDELVGEAG